MINIVNKTDNLIDTFGLYSMNRLKPDYYFLIKSNDSILCNCGESFYPNSFYLVSRDTIIENGIIENRVNKNYDPTNPSSLNAGEYSLIIDSIKTSMSSVYLIKNNDWRNNI